MSSRKFLWDVSRKFFTVGLIGLTVSDRYVSIFPVRGASMSPTLNPGTSSHDDHVLVEKFCLQKYNFKRGDVVVFCSPTNHKEKHIKRITGLAGEWFAPTYLYDAVRIPEGHCWVEGENLANSTDSRSFGPIPLGLIQGRATHVIWPPQRVGKINRRVPEGSRLPSF
ncbi:Peptidase S26 [Dillenia turbinata]|uniref:Mitochondrial inner membrane protease subunit 2 n=1 Tax=Dillenia turbinata TaxID=194707 RepID=A0AAN8W7K7_9MAGN